MILKTAVQTSKLYFVDFLANDVSIHQSSVAVPRKHCNAFRVYIGLSIICPPLLHFQSLFAMVVKNPVELENFSSCCGVADMIYNPLRTKLLLDAKKLGIPFAGGLIMLTAQAIKANGYFFDTETDEKTAKKKADLLAKEKENIVLIGMPGSGKSTVGAALSLLTGREVIDIDKIIEKETGKSIPQIFEECKEKGFRETEQRIIENEGKKSGKIIVTGGGAVTVDANYDSLKQNGRIYEIKRDISLLSTNGRPLSQDANLVEMYKKRMPMYEKFRDVCVENNTTPEDTAEKIRRDFFENSCY